MDPVSMIASITGIIAFTAKTAQSLTTLITEIRDAPTEIADLRIELDSLSSILTSAQSLSTTYTLRKEDAVLIQTLSQCVAFCQECMHELRLVVAPFAAGARGSGRRSPMRMISWTMHKGEVKNLSGKLRDRKASLTLAISVLNGHLTGKGQADIRKDMNAGYDRLINEFINGASGANIRRQLEDDLASVSAEPRPSSPSAQTDVGFAMRNYLDHYELATVPDEAPPIIDVTEEDAATSTFPQASDATQTLIQAVSAGDKIAVRNMLEKGAPVTERSPNGFTALHFCALYDDGPIAALLLHHGASVDAKNNERLTAFDLAIKENSLAVASILIERGSLLGDFTESMFGLLRSAEDISRWTPVLKALGRRFKDKDDSPPFLNRALELHDPRLLSLFLAEGFDPNASEGGYKPIHCAILLNRVPEMELLIKHGADVNAYLPPTAQRPDLKEVPRHALLLERGGRDFTPLLLASHDRWAKLPVFKFLLQHGADPNFEFPVVGDVVLNVHCANYYYPFAEASVQAGANVNFRDRDNGFSALYWAVTCANSALMTLLLDNGADVDIKTRKHAGALTPLHRAIDINHPVEAKILIERGANLTVRAGDGLTPLERARAIGSKEMKQIEEMLSRMTPAG